MVPLRTALDRRGPRREGRLWAALTDGEHSLFRSQSFPLSVVRHRGDPFALEIGDTEDEGGELTSGSAWGAFGDVEWTPQHEPDEYVFTPLGASD